MEVKSVDVIDVDYPAPLVNIDDGMESAHSKCIDIINAVVNAWERWSSA